MLAKIPDGWSILTTLTVRQPPQLQLRTRTSDEVKHGLKFLQYFKKFRQILNIHTLELITEQIWLKVLTDAFIKSKNINGIVLDHHSSCA